MYIVGISYLPLDEKAVKTVKKVGPVEIKKIRKKAVFCLLPKISKRK
jgi:hypothetical protein